MKKPNIRKTSTIYLFILILVFAITACTSGTNETKDTTSSTTGAATTEMTTTAKVLDATNTPFEKYAETVEFTCSRYVQTNNKLPEGHTYEDNNYSKFLLEKLNVKLKTAFEATGDDYARQISLLMASDDLPDIMTLPTAADDMLKELVEGDMIADITQAYEDCADDILKAKYDSYGGRALDKAMFDGKLMAIPHAQGDGGPHVAWVREDWFNAVKPDVDKDGDKIITVDELETIAKAFIAQDPGKTGKPVGMVIDKSLYGNNYGGAHQINNIASAFGAFPGLWLKGSDGKVTWGSIAPEMKNTLAELADWYKNGILDPQIGVRTWEDMNALLINNQCGIALGAWHITDWMLPNVRQTIPTATFTTFIVGNANGKVGTFHTNTTVRWAVVSKNFKHPELLVKIASLFYGAPLNEKITDEGINEYIKLGVDGSVRPLWLEIGYTDDLIKGYNRIMEGVEGKVAFADMIKSGEATTAEQIKKYIDNPATDDVVAWSRYHSRPLGIGNIKLMYENNKLEWVDPVFWKTTPTMTERWANLQTLENETFLKIITNAAPVNSFDTFVADWKSQGGDLIIGEIDKMIKK